MQLSLADIALALGLAMTFGGLIGLEREYRGQVAGLRTHMVVSLGSSLLMMISIDLGLRHHGDPGRIAAQVVSGIGFLGAGAIFRFGTSVKGVTTAACLWAAAGVGLACGARYYREAALTTSFVLIATFLLERIEHAFIHGPRYLTFRVVARDEPGFIGRVMAALASMPVEIHNVGVDREVPKQTVRLIIRGKSRKEFDVDAAAREISALPGILEIDVE
jgi:putative Mg2+ transporter-C (MgtC) family protein